MLRAACMADNASGETHFNADTAEEIYKMSKDQWIAYSIDHADGANETCGRPLVSLSVLLMYGLSFENL